ncbi:MFS transporter [Pseudomonas sp. PAMC 29040]|uniref:MFS transporter n=1 Tax=Pseudomonas sp. PAMC 29040 TaxID=2498450 RepID=UPI000FADEC00|nr:MFS transporter [Pseudomonas sp. PAMC 29040]RUT42401.1 MFS transporter [Pseudomonas sp. PAMC 29040]
MSINNKNWDARYEYCAVAMLALGFGLLGLDRFIILPLFPTIMHDLNLNYQDQGNISAVLSIAWGVTSVFIGALAIRIGHRGVLIGSLLMFSLLAGLSGLATGVVSLLIIRGVMGISEGAFSPISIAATMDASHPTRRGLNCGIQQALFSILGLGLAPIIATQLLLVVPSWRWVFVIVSIPGFLMAFVMYRYLREPGDAAKVEAAESIKAKGSWVEALRYRNLVLSIIGMFCMLTSLLVLSVMMPNYLIDYLQLSTQQMGFIMSAIGLGGFFGQLIVPAISDHIGRKPAVIGSFIATGVALWLLIHTGPEPLKLFLLLFAITFFNFSLICMNIGPITSEAVPAHLVSTATGLVVGIGEVFGGGIAPALAGFIAQNYGIQNTLYLAMGGVIAGLSVASMLKETAPRRIKLKATHEEGLDAL